MPPAPVWGSAGELRSDMRERLAEMRRLSLNHLLCRWFFSPSLLTISCRCEYLCIKKGGYLMELAILILNLIIAILEVIIYFSNR